MTAYLAFLACKLDILWYSPYPQDMPIHINEMV